MITRTMKNARPLNRNLASAIAARNASTIDTSTTTVTTIRLFSTPLQKYGVWIASVKWTSVGWSGTQTGLYDVMSSPGLERGRDHPVDREGHDDERTSGRGRCTAERRSSAAAPRLAEESVANDRHLTSPIRIIWRT